MAPSHRPASRFFAAFYRWNLQTQRPRPCGFSCQHSRHGPRHATSSYPRKYHATRLLRQQGQPEPPLRDEAATSVADGVDESRPAASAQEETATEPDVAAGKAPPIEAAEVDLDDQKLKSAVRNLLRKVPSSVAVITVASVDPHTKKHVPMGVAVSSLTSVTLDPPTISFNIKQPSATLDAIRAAKGLFRVHFPGADRGGANVVELFCRGNHTDAYNLRLKDLKLHLPSYWKDKRASASLAPQIWNDSIRAAMECTVTHELSVADHVIVAARVDSLEQKMSKEPTIVYVDGKYMRPETEIGYHARPKVSTPSDSGFSVWHFPLFPGEQERRDYVDHIKAIVKGSPDYLDKPIEEACRNLQLNLPYSPKAFGIDIAVLIAECKQETGRNNELRPDLQSMPVLSDFYGRLTPATRAKIVARAKRLVKEDPRFLSLKYAAFLRHLGVEPSSRDLLPSDIMTSLRAEGLADDFEPRKGGLGSTNGRHYDIQKLEQVEHHLRKCLRTLKYETALTIRLESLMGLIGEDEFTALAFKSCRSRLLAETHPQLFDDSKLDIVGEVTQEEARVVLSRVIHSLQVTNHSVFRRLRAAPYEILRLAGVHPTITGIDIEFLFAKIDYLYYSTPLFRDFARAIDKMLKPWFDSNVSWDDLEDRVKQFVQKTPTRAMSWSNKDKLAAMGLDWEASVTVPVQSGQKTQQPLNKSLILDTLVAKDLKNHHGNGTEAENQAIATYLQETYNFNVLRTPTVYTPQDPETRSSSDDMREARLANRQVNLMRSMEAKQKQIAFEKGETVAPRIRSRNNQNTVGGEQTITFGKAGDGDHPDKDRGGKSVWWSPPKKASTEWTSYTLGGEKK